MLKINFVQKSSLVLSATTLGILTTSLSASAAGLYSITRIAVPGVESYNPVKMTDNGQVLLSGYSPVTGLPLGYTPQNSAFVWKEGEISKLEFNVDPDSPSLVAPYTLYDINELGIVTGNISLYDVLSDGVLYNSNAKFAWKGGKIEVFTGMTSSYAYSNNSFILNKQGQFINIEYFAGGSYDLYLVNANTTSTQLIPPVAEGYAYFPWGTALNNKGQVAATFSYDNAVEPPSSFLWDNGKITLLGSLGGASQTGYQNYDATFVTGINDATQVVGSSRTSTNDTHAFLWENSLMRDLGTLGGNTSSAIDINEAGQVIGNSTASNGEDRGFLWQDGIMTDLGTLGGNSSSVTKINEAGQILGCSTTVSGGSSTFVWTAGTLKDTGLSCTRADIFNELGQVVRKNVDEFGQLRNEPSYFYDGEQTFSSANIETLLKENSGWDITTITGLNNKGQIIGTGLFNGQESAFLMTPNSEPVPEPSTVIGSVLGLGALVKTARQNRKCKSKKDK